MLTALAATLRRSETMQTKDSAVDEGVGDVGSSGGLVGARGVSRVGTWKHTKEVQDVGDRISVSAWRCALAVLVVLTT